VHFEKAFEKRLQHQFQRVRQSVFANNSDRTMATNSMKLDTVGHNAAWFGLNLFRVQVDFTRRPNLTFG
jgi:hypothetical protein